MRSAPPLRPHTCHTCVCTTGLWFPGIAQSDVRSPSRVILSSAARNKETVRRLTTRARPQVSPARQIINRDHFRIPLRHLSSRYLARSASGTKFAMNHVCVCHANWCNGRWFILRVSTNDEIMHIISLRHASFNILRSCRWENSGW